ncbi:MAG TPA: hypothetical protein VNC50_16310 [Planctomycetia bacterium]|nr:hypothetical protein [Planctomycetia bacterium]
MNENGEATTAPAPASPLGEKDDAAPPPGRDLLHDLWLVVWNPYRVFINLPRVNRAASALVLLLAAQAFMGWWLSGTGVHDYAVDVEAQKAVTAALRKHEGDEDPNLALTEAEMIEKTATFTKLVGAIGRTAGPPFNTLMVIGLLSSFLFVRMALAGGKPKFGVLAAAMVFASYVELPRQALRLWLVCNVKMARVETSAAAFPTRLGPPEGIGIGQYVALRRFDPFDLWFWILFFIAARTAAQLPTRKALVATLVVALIASLNAAGADYLELGVTPVIVEPS